MYVKKMGYQLDWAGPGMGDAVTAEICFMEDGHKDYTYVSYDDGPMGTHYNVTSKSILDVIQGVADYCMEEADFLESYEDYATAQKKSKYAFVISELEAYVQRILNIDQHMKDFKSGRSKGGKPYVLKLKNKKYKKYRGEGGDEGEDIVATASYLTKDNVAVDLVYKHFPDGTEVWGYYNDEEGSREEYDTFGETIGSEEQDGFLAFKKYIDSKLTPSGRARPSCLPCFVG